MIKIFSHYYISTIEDSINNWIKNNPEKNIKNIEFKVIPREGEVVKIFAFITYSE